MVACHSQYCLASGNGEYFTGNAWYDRRGSYGRETCDDATNWQGLQTPLDGQFHGATCANGSSLNTDTGIYHEYHKASAAGNITLGADAGNGRQYVAWISDDVNGTGHTGIWFCFVGRCKSPRSFLESYFFAIKAMDNDMI